MKKLIKIFLCLCLCVVSIGFTACGGNSKIEAPASNEVVLDNGGIVVQKGNFVYFGNGYKTADSVTKSTLDKKYKLGGLYMAKANDDNTFNREENGSLKSMSRLSSKLSSFEATDLHIFGDYMYYTTIDTEETGGGNLKNKHLEIYRVKLNGTKSERVYRSKVNFEDEEGKRFVNFHYYEDGSNVYILINEYSTLKRVVCSSSISSATTIATDIVSYKTASDKQDGNQIFYVTNVEDENYKINRYDIISGSVIASAELTDGDSISSIFDVKFNNVYFYATFEEEGTEFLYRLSFDNIEDEDSVFANSKKMTSVTYKAVYLLDSYSDGILAISANKVEIIDQQNPANDIELQSNLPANATIILVENGYVYYYAEKVLSRWNYNTDVAETIYTETNSICNYAFDIVGDYLYYYTTVNTNDYLFRVSISDTSEDKANEIVGIYETADAPEVEDDEE